MNVGVTMSPEVWEHKREEGRAGRRREGVWNTWRPPTRLTPGWTNRLYVASGGYWRGWFPLAGEALWCPDDEAAPVALIFDAGRWTRIEPVAAPRFRGWRYLERPPGPGPEAASDPLAESPPDRAGAARRPVPPRRTS